MKRVVPYAFFAIAGAGVLLGIIVRVKHFLYFDPVGVTGDLRAIWQVWVEFFGNDLTWGPSLRLNQFGYAFAVGMTSMLGELDFAHSAKLVAFASSMGLIPASVLLIYALKGDRFDMAAAALVMSLSPILLLTTLRAESEGPFLFTAVTVTAFLLLYWRNGKWPFLCLGILGMILMLAMRGTGLLHMGTLAVALISIYWIHNDKDRSGRRRLFSVVGGFVLAYICYAMMNSVVTGRVVDAYAERDGTPPKPISYTTYVMFDGLLAGPFPFSTPGNDGWSKRQKIVKGIDPETGERYSTPMTRNEPPIKVIQEDPGQYVKNYFVGVWRSAYRFLLRTKFNLLTTVPLLLGSVLLVWRRQWLPILFAGSWVSVYLFIVPAVFAHERTVWPACIGLSVPGIYLLGAAARWLNRHWQDRPRAVLIIPTSLLAALLIWSSFQTWSAVGSGFEDHRNLAREHIIITGERRPTLLSSESGITMFGEPLTYRQMTFATDAQTQEYNLVKIRPDYVFIYGPYRSGWANVYSAVIEAIQEPDNGVEGELVWERAASQLWKMSYPNTN